MDDSRAVSDWPGELLRQAYRLGGPVFRGRLGGTRYVYLIGPQAHALIFGHDEWFSAYEAMKVLIPVDGPTLVSSPTERIMCGAAGSCARLSPRAALTATSTR